MTRTAADAETVKDYRPPSIVDGTVDSNLVDTLRSLIDEYGEAGVRSTLDDPDLVHDSDAELVEAMQQAAWYQAARSGKHRMEHVLALLRDRAENSQRCPVCHQDDDRLILLRRDVQLVIGELRSRQHTPAVNSVAVIADTLESILDLDAKR